MAEGVLELNTRERVPAICFGGGARVRDERVFEAALTAGYRFLDTAVAYRNDHLIFGSEIGRGLIAKERESVVVCSKFNLWNPLPDAVQGALERMGLEYLDLLLLHHPVNPDSEDPIGMLVRTWTMMEQLVEQGSVRMIGLSNTGSSLLQFLLDSCRIPPVVNQVEFHPYMHDDGLLAMCQAAGVRVQAYCPLGSPWRQAGMGKLPPTADPVVTDIGRTKGRTPAQTILRWHVDKGVIPVVSATQPDHMKENLDVFDFQLTPAERDAIDALDRQERIWRDRPKLAGLYGTVADGVLTIPDRWPEDKTSLADPRPGGA